MELIDAERLAEAQQMDLDYWRAKLRAWAFHEPQKIIDEQTQFRSMVLAGPSVAPPTQEDWLARVAAIHAKMMRAGLVSPMSGTVN